jgi:hypothetical protein
MNMCSLAVPELRWWRLGESPLPVPPPGESFGQLFFEVIALKGQYMIARGSAPGKGIAQKLVRELSYKWEFRTFGRNGNRIH